MNNMKLSLKQKTILIHAISGLRDKEIALRVGSSTKAVKLHILKAMKDNECGNRMQLAAMFDRLIYRKWYVRTNDMKG